MILSNIHAIPLEKLPLVLGSKSSYHTKNLHGADRSSSR
jgi:hypothetical protein